MYLKQIKAHGFKSFADKMVIDLEPGITGIVGPNGSGKSNVVDAVRWVLGEQSIKSLRGEGNMTDVIFAGSHSRRSQNLASVTLIFDNMDHYLPFDFNEVALKRNVYRDGTNEYFINGEQCRLKDIITLLLDSGMARESLNIISQGKIDEILLSKPVDRRLIFEEAAGVLKYKKRKVEALHKLERTHDNMNRVSDIIGELENRIEPLKKQKEKAVYYNKLFDELKELDLSLLVFDIEKINRDYKQGKEQIEKLKEELLLHDSNHSKEEAEILDYKNKIASLDEKINALQQDLLKSTTLTEKLKGKKQIILERKKYEVEDQKLHSVLIDLKEKKGHLETNLHEIGLSLKHIELNLIKEREKENTFERQSQQIRNKRMNEEQKLSKLIRLRDSTSSRIEALKQSIDSLSNLPYAVKSVLENKNLSGIYNAIGNIIEVEEMYALAVSVALGSASTYIIVQNEQVAKEAIDFLKREKAGRATFFPINRIRGRKISDDVRRHLNTMEGYIGLANELVKTEPIYKNIIDNQLGTVIVVDDFNHANMIAKHLEHKYRIVTLDGDLFQVGGSITGGKQKIRNVIQDKYDLENDLKEQKVILHQIESSENLLNELDDEAREMIDKIYITNKSIAQITEQRENKIMQERKFLDTLEQVKEEMNGAAHLLHHSLDEEENQIMDQYYDEVKRKDTIQSELQKYIDQKEEFTEILENYEQNRKQENSLYHQKSKELSSLEIDVGKADVKLDNLLSYLSETYGMTYEKASLTYHLHMDENKAREQLHLLKKECKDLGPVNLDAISEYDELAKRYEFLISQREDLISAENTLLTIVEEMDAVMIREFKSSFDSISKHFEDSFVELFHGGEAHLKLTDPHDLLTTGIEIEASPPGKSLKSISLLSGGEKTFTAISLLFAILKSRPVPFCILDEVEAALDEVNVDSFGKYIQKLKEKTQFILITHKKKTMEYADVLYGITMRQSGVSKLVSVRLEELNEK